MEGGWSVVNRHRRRAQLHKEVTTMYVSNIPDGATKPILTKTFAKYGEVVDVYMALKKDATKKNFGFVRFGRVTCEAELEKSLQTVKCLGVTLSVNISRFDRKEHPRKPSGNNVGRIASMSVGNRNYGSSFLDGRSFAKVANVGIQQQSPPPPPPPILVEKPVEIVNGTYMDGWFNSRLTLIGEAHSLKELQMIPPNLRSGNNDIHYGMQYLGGLMMGIRFKSEGNIEEFLSNESYWGAWFKSFTPGDTTKFETDRIAWLKIAGLPVVLWSEENLSRIAGKFGKVLVLNEIIPTAHDFSLGDICVLTSYKKRINEDVKVVLNGNVFGVGVIEKELDWSPFHSDTYEVSQSESEEEVASESGDVTSSEGNDKEEGEIKLDDDTERVPESMATVSENEEDEVVGDISNTPTVVIDDLVTERMERNRVGDQSPVVGVCDVEPQRSYENSLKSHPINTPRDNFIFNAGSSKVSYARGSFQSDSNGGLDGLVKMGAFGPFYNNPSFARGRILPASLSTWPNPFNSEWTLEPEDPEITKKRRIIDLNNCPTQSNIGVGDDTCIATSEGGELDQVSSKLNEAVLTVEVGKVIGIDMEPTDTILLEALGVDGENNGN
ncbi:hypothetical protein L2E82_33081 [Cichorium intybus]|uniref:Uncharacterized protein n=1 Tax=Cichorium intybus TaxID=13427 RepID=A0ACB9BJ81_CICIN|nr:hypothetical protein L2E82_33081 [Cichorium intybus]